MKLLIAEDDPDMQKILKLYLQREGCQVNIVDNGRAAIDFLSEDQVDLVILDWMMPVQDGIQTCREILLLRNRKLCQAENIMSYRDVFLNPDTMEVTKQGEKIMLTKTEYELLKFFLSNQRRVLSRELLLDHIWGIDYEGDIRTCILR